MHRAETQLPLGVGCLMNNTGRWSKICRRPEPHGTCVEPRSAPQALPLAFGSLSTHGAASTCGLSGTPDQPPQASLVRRSRHAALGDDRGHQLVWSDVECRVGHLNARGRDLALADMRELARIATLDGDLVAARAGQINR